MNLSLPHNSLPPRPIEKKPLGQLLNEAGLISAQQVELALIDQLVNKSPKKIGEIFAEKGWIKQETADFFVERWYEIIEEKPKQPLVYYFREAALLDETQINEILEQRNKSSKKIRFHHLAVQKGLVKKETVDFFLRHILVPKRQGNKDSSASATPYELLKNYIRGETNFQRSELRNIKLNNVTLKGVNLDNSNLIRAELKQANLSNSSLKKANLSQANLEKAILEEVDFESACLKGVNLTDAHLEGSNFRQANLIAADLRDSYFANACFLGANLKQVKIQGANFQGALYNSETSFDSDFNPNDWGMKLIV